MEHPEFTFAEDPTHAGERQYIVHMRDPVVIAEVFHFDLDQEQAFMDCQRHFTFGSSVDYPAENPQELIFLGGIYCGSLPANWNIWTKPQEIADNLAQVMSRMGDWYHTYLTHIDEDLPLEED